MGRSKSGSQRVASWIFGGIAFAFLIWAFIFGPDELPAEKQRILGIMCALLAGLFGYFFTGSMNLIAEGNLPKWGKVTIQASGGAALFALVLWWWGSGYAPVRRIENKITDIDKKVAQIVGMLREELSIKNKQIVFLQGEIARVREITPSERARELAERIPDDASPYALALKAIAQKRFKDARRFLRTAQEQKEIELAEIHRTRGKAEFYAGNYLDSLGWYEKALELAPDNVEIGKEAAVVFFYNAKYEKAEALMRSAVEILEDTGGEPLGHYVAALNNLGVLLHETNRVSEAEAMYRRVLEIVQNRGGDPLPSYARALNNLAALLGYTNRLGEAEPLVRQALVIDEKCFGKDHPNVARDLNNLALVLKTTNRPDEAEPLMRRALAIDEKSYGQDHPEVAIGLHNLAGLLQATNRLEQAEPMYRRVVEIFEKSFGSQHPSVAGVLNNLAELLRATNRLDEAEPIYRRALAIYEKSFGKDHPKVAIALNNLAGLLLVTNRVKEARPMYERALEILEKSLGPDHPTTQKVRENVEGLE